MCCVWACACASAPVYAQAHVADGIVWQPDNAHVDPQGDWNKLGAHELIVQWTAVDGISFVPGAGLRPAPHAGLGMYRQGAVGA